jgi:diguanylate cyclase (GGDEF)-like protein
MDTHTELGSAASGQEQNDSGIPARLRAAEQRASAAAEISTDDLDNLKKLTDTKLIEIASGDIVDHIQFGEIAHNTLGKQPGSFYRDIIFALIQIRLPEEDAKRDWKEILRHKYTMSETLGRNVGIHVATLDYYTNVKKMVTNPKIVEADDYVDTANMAITDELTKGHNRAFFDEQIRRQFTDARATGRVFSLLMLDLDHFKAYNDSNGHIQGDLALIETVRILHAVCGWDDVVARFGGEEFTVILPEKGPAEALAAAEHIRQAIYDYRFVNEQNVPGGRLSVSVGVTSYRGDTRSAIEMVDEADVALYQAKNGGRNMVKVFVKSEQ